ncbi:hypothetical protein Tco_0744101 [Tanacetum coccineum]
MIDKDKVLSNNPFNLYDILNKRKDSGDNLKYPPSFTPSMTNVEKVNKKVKGAISNEVNELVNSISNKLEESVPKGKFSSNNSVCSKRVHTGGSILQLIDELVKEIKMESMKLVTIMTLWGNSSFDYVLSSFLGNLGGILCVWEPTLFVKDNVISSDKFLAVMGLLASFLYLSALCLDRNLSDHRPILMRELSIDYGPTLFRFFHCWFNLDGFDKMVEDTWKSLALVESNDLLLKELNDINSIDSLEAAQKSKVCWAIEGDENTKFFHDQFTNRLSLEQHADLERNVSNEKIKSVIWDCGTNKSPGPNGLTFKFFRRYWKLLEHDIVAAVKDFFALGLISDVQLGFVSNRQILDGPFILNELLHGIQFRRISLTGFPAVLACSHYRNVLKQGQTGKSQLR